MRLNLLDLDLSIVYVPGKDLHIADNLLRINESLDFLSLIWICIEIISLSLKSRIDLTIKPYFKFGIFFVKG